MHDTLISAEALLPRLDDADWLVIDCRHDLANTEAGHQAFLGGHIPGAQHLHLDKDLSGPPLRRSSAGGLFSNGGRHPLPEAEVLRARLGSLGIGDATQVVAVDAQGGMFAARLWWLLRWLGHERVAVLDGGLSAWTAAGGLLETGPGRARPSRVLSPRPALVREVGIDTVFGNLTTHALDVIDARAPDRFRGENETLDPVGGHIPGARNRFFRDNLQADGRFKPAAALRAEWSALIGVPSNAVMQCGSGVTACHNLLALQIAGLNGASLYPGSWSDWVSEDSRPVETGVAPH